MSPSEQAIAVLAPARRAYPIDLQPNVAKATVGDSQALHHFSCQLSKLRDSTQRRFALKKNPDTHTLLVSANTAWNIANFREGLIRFFLAQGFRIVCAAPPDGHQGRLEALGCRFVPIHFDTMGTSPLADLNLLRSYVQLMRDIRPDLFLGFTIKPNVYGSLAARMLGVPTINTVTGLGTAFIRNNWLTRLVKRLYKLSFSGSDVVFFQNGEDKDFFVDLGLVDPSKAVVVPGSGVDLGKFQFAGLASHGRASRLLLIARILADKGVYEFVEAARIVKKTYPDALFCLLGSLDAVNKTAIAKREVHDWDREGTIRYLGTTDDVRPFIADADCVVLPSYREGAPRALLEAASMGRPLIATNVVGCRDVVIDGKNGFLCEARNAVDLARALERFLALDGTARAAMGRASRSMVEARYDEQILFRAYLTAVRQALA